MRKDIDLSFKPHPVTGDLVVKKDRSAVEQAIKNLVMTNSYERGYNVQIACNIRKRLFMNMTPLNKQSIKTDIESVIGNFEPSAEIEDVRTEEQNNGHELVAKIYYYAFNNPDLQVVEIPLERTG